VHALATSATVLAQKPGVIVAVTRAIASAQRLLHSDRDAALAALLKTPAAPSDRRLAAAILSVYAPAVPASPRISIPGIVRARELYPAHPRHPDFTKLDPAAFVATEIAAAAAGN
jgi:hypothetical protein